jgi:ketosteroid isomerase-like protein
VTAPISLTDLFRSIDAKDAVRFAAFLTPDATFRFGNAPPVTGRTAIAQAVEGFFGTIRALEHNLREHWQGPDSLVCEGEVTYTRHDGTRLTVPFVDVFRLRAGLIQDYLIYMDITPLYAPAA